MIDTQQRQYLDDVPRDLQDLIYEGKHTEATQLLMDQKGLQKMQAAMEAGSIALRMSAEFPGAVEGPSYAPTMTAQQWSRVMWVVIAFLLVIGALFTAIGVHGLTLGFESRSWPSTEGQITQSKVERRKSSSGTGKKRTAFYHAIVNYKFSVDGRPYKGSRVSSADAGRGKPEHAERTVKRYPEGSSATVYYMPEAPGTCLLEPGFQVSAFVFSSIGLILLLLSGVLLVVNISKMGGERKAEERFP